MKEKVIKKFEASLWERVMNSLMPGHDMTTLMIKEMRNRILHGPWWKQIPDESTLKTEDIITRLMIYAVNAVTDQRFAELIKKNDPDYLRQIVHLNDSTGISALTLAAAKGNITHLTMLFDTKAFSEEHLAEALYLAANFGQAQSVDYLLNQGVFPFKKCFSEKATSLHIASARGHLEVVKTILATNPDPTFLSLRTRFYCEDQCAVEIAKARGNMACYNLFSHTRDFKWLEKINAIEKHQLSELQELLAQDTYIGNFLYQDNSLIGMAASEIVYNDNNWAIFDMLIEKLAKLPVEIQVNSLLASLASMCHAQKISHDLKQFKDDLERSHVLYNLLFEKLQALKPRYKEITNLSIDAWHSSKKLFSYCINVIIAEAQPIEIYLSFYSDYSDYLINIYYDSRIVEFLTALVSQTKLLSCNLMTITFDKPLKDLLDLIIERNLKMEEAFLNMTKNKIFTHYLSKINNLIRTIKTENKRDYASLTELDEPPKEIYSLTELTTFFICNEKSLFKRVCAEKEHLPQACNDVLDKLIADVQKATI